MSNSKEQKIKMKLLVLAICVFSAISCNEASEALEKLKAEVANIAMECAKENGATDDEVNNFLGKISAPETHGGQCMLRCVGQRMGTLDVDGKYSDAGTKAFFESLKHDDGDIYNKILAIAEKCQKEIGTGADHCTTVANFYECTLKAEKEMMG